MSFRSNTFGDFRCIHCRVVVSADITLSAVNNRNHCPYCLWSRHLDLYEAGDRLCACKGAMRPVGLTFKRRNKKYGHLCQGELMLVHQCVECNKFSLNRIAADDIAERIYEVFRLSARIAFPVGKHLDFHPLGAADDEVVRARLFGSASSREMLLTAF